MNPIFKEYTKFLKDNTDLDLEEGFFWLDNQIIKAFDTEGNLHKLYRLKVEDDLSVTYRIPKGYTDIKDVEIETWKQTVKRLKENVIEKEKESIALIKECLSKYDEYIPIALTSGGKDSSVTMDLVRKTNPNVQAIFNNTTLDCADTYKHIKTIDNVMTINPKEGFYQWRERLHFVPTRFARACCSIFKEGAMMDVLNSDDKYIFFLGMRNEESSARSGYEDYWKNEKWSNSWYGCLPIRKWTEIDIWVYILMNDLSVNEKYRKGYSRAGCAIACPFASKSTWALDKYWYPTMRQRWERILRDDFITNKKWIIMNCTIKEYIQSAWNGGTYRDEPTQEVIDEFARYNGLDVGDTKVAKQYFNKSCSECGKRIKSKEVLAMNMKFHGREITKFMCKKCFKKLYEMDDKGWQGYVDSFKRSGCALFDKQEEK